MNILFVCNYNAVRSQMAEALAQRLVPNATVQSAGHKHLGSVMGDSHEVSPLVVSTLADVGIDWSQAQRKLLSPEVMAEADIVVTFTQELLPPAKDGATVVFWDVPDVMKTNPENLPEVVREIESRVRKLLKI